ncbi:pyridoxal kinase-like [Diadema setosum]|uniref:pyridoxal kinase-like n=1 Tax=Diadema setosum TaxID=31175 RepID=UPI003B3B3142
MALPDHRVISIQSHVVSGYVGNKSAVFPMQVLGYEVDAVNSVQLCCHTGYKHFQGQVLNDSDLRTLFDGLKLNDIHQYSHLLTGYVGSESFLHEVIRVVKELREANPDITYVCDPVLGDNGHFYVPKELMPIYRDQLLPLADIITPNQFEAELLSGVTINDEESALRAISILHDKGIKTVILSSFEAGKEDKLVTLGSTVKGNEKTVCRLEFSRLDCTFTGTGDLFSALMLVWTHKHPDNLLLACEKALSTMQAVLKRTLLSAQELAGPGNVPTAAQRELRLVKSKQDIEEPPSLVAGKYLEL